VKIETELRSASDALLAALAQLEELELQKRDLKPGSRKFVALARQIQSLSDELLAASRSETVLADRVADRLDRGQEAPQRSIAEMPPERDLGMILSEWRDAERRLAAARPDSAEAKSAREDADRLRHEYRTVHRAAAPTAQRRRAKDRPSRA
jgi:hypothetical protein